MGARRVPMRSQRGESCFATPACEEFLVGKVLSEPGLFREGGIYRLEGTVDLEANRGERITGGRIHGCPVRDDAISRQELQQVGQRTLKGNTFALQFRLIQA